MAIENLGATPAYNVRMTAAMRYRDTPDFNPDTMDVSKVTPIVLGSHIALPCIIGITQTGFDTSARNPRLFLFGKIQFTDIFDDEQTVTFCYHYVHKHRFFTTYPYKDFNKATK